MTSVENIVAVLENLCSPSGISSQDRQLLATAGPALVSRCGLTMLNSGTAPCRLSAIYKEYCLQFGQPFARLKNDLPANNPVAPMFAQHSYFLRAIESLENVNDEIFKMETLPINSVQYKTLLAVFEHLDKMPSHIEFEERFLFGKLEREGYASAVHAAKLQHMDFMQTFTGFKHLVKSFVNINFNTFKARLNTITKSLVPITTTHLAVEEMTLYWPALENCLVSNSC